MVIFHSYVKLPEGIPNYSPKSPNFTLIPMQTGKSNTKLATNACRLCCPSLVVAWENPWEHHRLSISRTFMDFPMDFPQQKKKLRIYCGSSYMFLYIFSSFSHQKSHCFHPTVQPQPRTAGAKAPSSAQAQQTLALCASCSGSCRSCWSSFCSSRLSLEQLSSWRLDRAGKNTGKWYGIWESNTHWEMKICHRWI